MGSYVERFPSYDCIHNWMKKVKMAIHFTQQSELVASTIKSQETSGLLKQALAENATADIVGEVMLDWLEGGWNYIYMDYFGYCPLVAVCTSHI